MSLIPMREKVYVLPLEDRQKVGSLYIPEQARQKCDQGIVMYVGPDVPDIKVGDHIAFSGYTGTRLEDIGEALDVPPYRLAIEGEITLITMNYRYIMAILGEESEPLFPLSLINEFLDKARGDVIVQGVDPIDVHRVVERLRTFMNDYFTSRGLMF